MAALFRLTVVTRKTEATASKRITSFSQPRNEQKDSCVLFDRSTCIRSAALSRTWGWRLLRPMREILSSTAGRFAWAAKRISRLTNSHGTQRARYSVREPALEVFLWGEQPPGSSDVLGV